MIEICTVGGYNQVGKNCTAVKVDDEAYILDMGIYLENYVKLTEDDDDDMKVQSVDLIKAGVVPDITKIDDWIDDVKLILPTHAHLDHIGAIPFLANKFDAPILCTPFTAEVIKASIEDKSMPIKNEIKSLQSNSTFEATQDTTIEFIHVTHSTPHTVMIALHTKKGVVLYANDFKFDLSPTLGKRPNFKRLRELGKKGVHAVIVDSTYAADPRKMPSESFAKQKLQDVLYHTNTDGKAIIVTTFSSHIARLHSIVECAQKLKRKVLFLGRSLSKYSSAAEKCGIVNFSNRAEIARYSSQIKRKLKSIQNDRHKYLLVVTGHQGEPKATLSRMARGEFDFKIKNDDLVIFSSRVIPTPTNQENSDALERLLKQHRARIFRGVHESGHAAREDLRDFIEMVQPKHIIPAHGGGDMKNALAELAEEMGYVRGESVHVLEEGERISI